MKQKDLPKGPLTIEFFEQLPKGAMLRLYYHCVNTGDFIWKHDHVEGDRVFGSFLYDSDDDPKWVGPDDYLYEFMGDVCRGSGAEPVHARRPRKRDRYG